MPPREYLKEQLQLLAEEEGPLSRDEILALWFLRRFMLIDDLDSYEFVRDELETLRADAFAWTPAPAADDPPSLQLIGVVRGEGELPAEPVEALWQTVSELRAAGDIRTLSADLLTEPVADYLARTYKGKRKANGSGPPAVSGAVVTDMAASDAAKAAAAEAGSAMVIYDAERLERYARAIAGPDLVPVERTIEVDESERLVAVAGESRVLVCPVAANEIVGWPGIEDRSLFDLNVRFALGAGRVRASLDQAIQHGQAHADFLASHNGLTVLCSEFEAEGEHVSVKNLSVVNGAQTVIALHRNSDSIGPQLRVLVKFVAVQPGSQLAREIAIRSNTQNPVNSRNLRALDPRQLALKQEFEERFDDVEFVTRPDIRSRTDGTTIRNDDAAQWLAAVYNEMPWLAVKRDSLFANENYKAVFSPRIGAAEILLCQLVRDAVESVRGEVPPKYAGSWRLTALVLVYLVGQLLRTSDRLRQVLADPEPVLRGQREEAAALLEALAQHAADTMRQNLSKRGDDDDFKVDFKSQAFLRRLGSMSRNSFTGTSR
jgi:hypothetical protein